MAERKRIYLCLAHMSEAGLEQKYIKEAFDTNWVVPLGPNVNAFEKDLEEFVSPTPDPSPVGRGESPTPALPNREGERKLEKRVVALSSGTAAVHLALIACGVGPGDEVCVQSFTFCASSHPITYLGATPVFIDSEKDTWNMDPGLLEEAIKDRIAKTGKKPKAIIPVALYGMPYKADRIMEIADKYDIPVIEDAAEGFGSRYNGQMLGTFGKYGVLSFNGNKMITTSGGGALITSPTPALPSREGESPYMTADPTLYGVLKEYAREMRNNPTDAEKAAWSILCDEKTGYKFRRQHIIGDYIVDFVCLEKMLVVEIDGEYHNEWEQQIDDAARTEWLAIKGFRVIRFSNEQVIAAPELFERKVKEALALQSPLPTGEGWGGAETIKWLATQARESYPYYQHEKIGYNYRMSNICAGIGRGQMTVANDHIAHHKHVQALYEELLKDVKGITVHKQPATGEYDSNYWLCTITLDPDLKIKGQENAYKTIVQGAVGGAAGVIHAAESAHTDCEPNANVEAMRVALDKAQIEARPVWKPMHKQPVYCRTIENGQLKMDNLPCGAICQTSETSVSYVNGVSEAIFKVGMCLPAGPYVSDDDVRYIVDTIKANIIG